MVGLESTFQSYLAVSKKLDPFFGSPHNEDHSMLGSVFGRPVFGTPPSSHDHGPRMWRSMRRDPTYRVIRLL